MKLRKTIKKCEGDIYMRSIMLTLTVDLLEITPPRAIVSVDLEAIIGDKGTVKSRPRQIIATFPSNLVEALLKALIKYRDLDFTIQGLTYKTKKC